MRLIQRRVRHLGKGLAQQGVGCFYQVGRRLVGVGMAGRVDQAKVACFQEGDQRGCGLVSSDVVAGGGVADGTVAPPAPAFTADGR